MENNRTYIVDLPKEVYDFIKEEKSISKNIKYGSRFKNMGMMNRVYVDEYPDKICFISELVKIRRVNSSYFFGFSDKRGFTFTKETKKIKVWFGSTISQIPRMVDFMKIMKIDWFEAHLYQYLTKGGLEKILSGKITNPIDLCSYYLKANRFKDVSPRLFYKASKEKKLSKIHLFSIGKVCLDINNFILKTIKEPEILYDGTICDTAYQAGLLEEKINILWSRKRFMDVHNKFTNIIMDIEQETLEDMVVDYNKIEWFPQNFPKEIILMNTKKEIYKEGKMMKHCIYTNYWSRIEKEKYAAFKILHEKGRATLGCFIYDGGLKFDQIFGIGNTNPDSEVVDFAKSWVDKYKSNSSKESKELELLNVEWFDAF